jgi:hypothetical protein
VNEAGIARAQELGEELYRGSEGAQEFLDRGQTEVYGGWKDENEFLAVQQMWEAERMDDAKRANYATAVTQRWISQSVNYVHGMVESGQWTVEEGRNRFRNTVMIKNPDGSYSYELGDKWMTFTEEEFVELDSRTQQELLSLGWQPNGLGQVVPVLLEDADFGMGGYDYGDYAYGGGGGGYTPEQPKPRTGSRASTSSGGRYTPRSGRLTAGSVPPAHWRI